MKVYTKTGDNGTTSLIGGQRIKKSDIRLEIYGTIDELSSFLGLLKSQDIDTSYKKDINNIQQTLIQINIVFAIDEKENPEIAQKYQFDNKKITWIETKIDNYDKNLPPITEFLIPGKNQNSSICNICRTICRRTERRIFEIELSEEQKKAAIFVNRLSDFLFILSRKLT